MNRQERKRIAATATELYLQQHNVGHPDSTRQQRRADARLLRKRVLRETPASMFEPHSIVKPQIIVPEIEIQAEGIDTGKQENRSPSGRLILP